MKLPAAFDRYRAEIERELKEVLAGRDVGLYQMLHYQLGWFDQNGRPLQGHGGKRLRPVLCLATCETLGGDYRRALPAAAAVELVHNFSLVHDDIEDGSPRRHDQPAVWTVWGAAQAINVGDSMHALGRLALCRLQERDVSAEDLLWAMRLLDEAGLRLCEGQFLDMLYQESIQVDTAAYLTMVKSKTAALISCAMQLGALVATGDPAAVEVVGRSGVSLGIAFQIKDDLVDLRGSRSGGNAPDDIIERKKTFPVVYALEHGTPATKGELVSLYQKEKIEPDDVERVVAILEEIGALAQAEESARRYCEEAVAVLETLQAAACNLEEIRQIARFVVERQTWGPEKAGLERR